MVGAGHADFAETTVLAPWRFDQVAGGTGTVRMEDNTVVWIGTQMTCKASSSDDLMLRRSGVGGTEIG